MKRSLVNTGSPPDGLTEWTFHSFTVAFMTSATCRHYWSAWLSPCVTVLKGDGLSQETRIPSVINLNQSFLRWHDRVLVHGRWGFQRPKLQTTCISSVLFDFCLLSLTVGHFPFNKHQSITWDLSERKKGPNEGNEWEFETRMWKKETMN